jgi:sulfite reductase beta subunit-like hemoprotein
MKPTQEHFDRARALHAGRVEAYRRGELQDGEFRAIRLSYGLYYQLDHTSYMQRIKLPGGFLSADQIDVLAGVVDDYGRGITHVTTRQDVQIHWVPLERVADMYERLEAVGITTRGACSDSVRNVTGCPFAGASPDEPFDVSPYVLAIHDFFLFNPLNLTLPRKFKIAVESCPLDCAQATINDIALYAQRRGDAIGFSVWAGGGLGAAPFLAVPVAEFVPAEDALVWCEAIVRVQHRSGERKNRHKARLKFLVKKLGVDAFVRTVRAEVERVESERGDELRRDVRESVQSYRLPEPAAPRDPVAPLAGFDAWARTNAAPQRDREFRAVTVTLPLGDIDTAQLRAIGRLARELGNGTLRATNEQNLVLPWVRRAALPELHARLAEIGLAEGEASLVTDVVACPGLDYCSLAVTRSMGVGERIRRHLAGSAVDAEALGPFHVKISGCPNSCGQHHIGDVGLTGMMVKDGAGIERPHYSLLLGGGVGEGRTRIGKRLVGRYDEDDAPRAIAALAAFYRERRASGERFGEFVDRVGADELDAVARGAAVGEVR